MIYSKSFYQRRGSNKLQITGWLMHLRKEMIDIGKSLSRIIIPSNKFLFIEFFVTSYIELSNDLFREFF